MDDSLVDYQLIKQPVNKLIVGSWLLLINCPCQSVPLTGCFIENAVGNSQSNLVSHNVDFILIIF